MNNAAKYLVPVVAAGALLWLGCAKNAPTQSDAAVAGADTGTPVAAADAGAKVAADTRAPDEVAGLKSAHMFDSIPVKADRSVALFTEAGKVLQHRRCTNCHPAGERPLQGEDGALHEPGAIRGPTGHGVVGMRCVTCHTSDNVELGDRSIPGNIAWHLAPESMAWEGKSLAKICAQLKDKKRNGNRDLNAIVEHVANDPLVGWAWKPGSGRTTPPGDQATTAALLRAWVDTGADCPAGP